MSTTGLLFALVVTCVSLAWLALPIISVRRVHDASAPARKLRDELLTTYERVLASIRDLDEDYQMGKLDAETYETERTQWMQRGSAVLHQIEQVTLSEPEKGAETPKTTDLDDAVEAMIARYARSAS